MGLPMDKLVIATNSNDILARFWKTGRYERVDLDAEAAAAPANGASDGQQSIVAAKGTLSPAMDILISSNFERLLWYLAYEAGGGGSVDAACAVIHGWMKTVKSNGRVEVPREVLEFARRDFTAERVSDDQARIFLIECFIGIERATYTDTCDDTEVSRRVLLHRRSSYRRRVKGCPNHCLGVNVSCSDANSTFTGMLTMPFRLVRILHLSKFHFLLHTQRSSQRL